jgi:hypothetical protein
MSLMSSTLDWRCERRRRSHSISFSLDQIEAVPFLIVRHMVKDHGMTPEAVGEEEPCLAGEVEAYCREMGV